MEYESKAKEHRIIVCEGKRKAYCLNCGDLDERYQPLHRDDFITTDIIRCFRCGEVIRGQAVVGLVDDKLALCLECAGSQVYEPLGEQDLLPGEKAVYHCCGKTVKEEASDEVRSLVLVPKMPSRLRRC
jgi:hypothetical protein